MSNVSLHPLTMKEFLSLITLGRSFLQACNRVGVSEDVVMNCIRYDESFRNKYNKALDFAMSQGFNLGSKKDLM